MMRTDFIEHRDYPSTIREHHAHEALGSSALRRYLTDEQPKKGAANMGNAVGWLATTPQDQWEADDAHVVQRPNLQGYPGGIAGWEADNPSKLGLPKAEYAMAVAMATAVREHKTVRRLLESPNLQIEHTVLAKHAETGVLCKARPDLRVPGVWIGDIKISRSATPLGFRYAVSDYGYDLQAALYHDIEASRFALERLRFPFDLIVVSREPPHKVGHYSMPDSWMERGRRMLGACLRLRQLHQKTGERPPVWWEQHQYLPGPSKRDREEDERVSKHVHDLWNREHAQRGADVPDPQRQPEGDGAHPG